MPPKKLLSQLGNIEEFATTYTADIQHRDGQGKKQHIRGPGRSSRTRAERDLASMREASQGHATWAEGLAAMHSENLELHQASEKEARVAMGIDQYLSQRMAHKVEDSDPDTEGDDEGDCAPDAYDYSDPQVLEKCLAQPPVPKQGPTQPPRDADEATARLACFRATQETPDALRVLLSARADPNVVAGEGDLCPLMRVIIFAHEDHVHEMRDLLIDFGATNGEAELKRWKMRLDADRADPIYLREFHRSANYFVYLSCLQVALADMGPRTFVVDISRHCMLRYPIWALEILPLLRDDREG